MGTKNYKRLSLGGVLVALAVLASGQNEVYAGSMDEGSFIDSGAGNFYIGLSYNPAIGKVRDFAIKESTGETRGVFPYRGNKKKVELKAINFDWDSPDPRITFNDSKVLAFDGSVGYGIGGGRVELEVGYEKFKTKGVKKGDGEEEGIYLLAKDLAYDVALDQTAHLATGIQGLAKKDMHAVSNAINILNSSIDAKICKKGAYSNSSQDTEKADHCGLGHGTTNNTAGGLAALWYPYGTNDAKHGGNYGKDSTDKMGNHTSETISKDTSALSREEKGVMSSVFAKVIEGAEIVEIRSISTTSVMVLPSRYAKLRQS